MGMGFQFDGLANEALVNNVIGRIAFTFQSNSVTAGVRNLGVSIGVSDGAAGLYTLAWPTSTAVEQRGSALTTVSYGQFGTDTDRPPMVVIQPGRIAASIDVVGAVTAVGTAGATISLIGFSHNPTTNSAVSAGPITASAGVATAFVFPCTMSALNAQSFSFVTT